MSAENSDPRIDQAAVTDESLLVTHEKLLGKQPDDKGHYRLMPLTLLFTFSGLIFFGGTYLGLFAGHFDAHIYNEHAHPGAAAEAPVTVDPVVAGKKLFDATCAACHQVTGVGQPGVIPPLVESEWVNGSEERVIRIVLYGLHDQITVKGVNYGTASMPPFGKGVPGSGYSWSDDKVAAVLTYVRQAFGNKAPEVTTDKVTEVHNKEGQRAPVTAAELSKLP